MTKTWQGTRLLLMVLIYAVPVLGVSWGCSGTPEATLSKTFEPEVEARVGAVARGLRPSLQAAGSSTKTRQLEARLKALDVPGVSVAVIEDSAVVWACSWGIADAESGRVLTSETPFIASSMAKTVAATLALKLVAEGLLQLDQPINENLGSWSVPDNQWTEEQPVTLRLLLGHRAGFPRGYFDLPAQGPMPALVDCLAGKDHQQRGEVLQTPGLTFSYSNIGYAVLQLLLEEVAGMPYAELLESRLAKPLGMADSACDPLAATWQVRVARGHQKDGSAVAETGRVPPAIAGLWTSAEDYARVVAALLGSWRGNDPALLPQALMQEMFSPGVEGYGFGVYVAGTGENLTVQHSGGYTGFRSRFMAFPATGQGAVVMVNSDRGEPLTSEILAAIGAVYGWPDHPLVRPVVELDSASLAAFAGAYRCLDSPSLVLRVTSEGSNLKTRINQYRPALYQSVGPDLFANFERGRTHAFRRNAGGEIVGLVSNRAGYADAYYARIP